MATIRYSHISYTDRCWYCTKCPNYRRHMYVGYYSDGEWLCHRCEPMSPEGTNSRQTMVDATIQCALFDDTSCVIYYYDFLVRKCIKL